MRKKIITLELLVETSNNKEDPSKKEVQRSSVNYFENLIKESKSKENVKLYLIR